MRIITLDDSLANEHVMIKQFISYPEVIVHIRKPNFDVSQMMNFIAGFTYKQREQLVLHSYQIQSSEWGFRRAHYPARQRPHLPVGDKMEHRRISTSTHSWSEFNQLDKLYQDALMSPVFSSFSKKEYQGNPLIHHTDKRTNFTTSLIALGGISSKNLHSLPKGFDDIALCGGIWLAADPLVEFNMCYQQWHKIKKSYQGYIT